MTSIRCVDPLLLTPLQLDYLLSRYLPTRNPEFGKRSGTHRIFDEQYLRTLNAFRHCRVWILTEDCAITAMAVVYDGDIGVPAVITKDGPRPDKEYADWVAGPEAYFEEGDVFRSRFHEDLEYDEGDAVVEVFVGRKRACERLLRAIARQYYGEVYFEAHRRDTWAKNVVKGLRWDRRKKDDNGPWMMYYAGDSDDDSDD